MDRHGQRRVYIPPMAIWAMRDLGRRAGNSVLLFLSLLTLVVVVATPLLLTKTLARSSEILLGQGPSLVVRRVTGGGWATIPVREPMARIRAIPGVIDVRARVWGLSSIGGTPVTLIGVVAPGSERDKKNSLVEEINMGEGLAGVGTGLQPGDTVELGTGGNGMVRIAGLLPRDTSSVSHDILLLHVVDCRRILAIPDGEASDLVVDVFQESEEKAIVPDLARAFDWPVQIVSRTDMLGVYRGGVSRRGGIGLLMTIPALLALLLLVLSVLKQAGDGRREMGILKAVGWSSGDMARLQLWKTLLLGIPAVTLGACLAYGLIFTPAVRFVAVLFLGWQGSAPHFVFSSAGSLSLLAMVCALVFLPFFAAVMGPLLLSSTADPVELIRKD